VAAHEDFPRPRDASDPGRFVHPPTLVVLALPGRLGFVDSMRGAPLSEANKEIIRRYQEAYNTNNLDVLDELLDPHWKTNGWVEGVPQSVESAREVYQAVLQAFPDVQWHPRTPERR
jgi:hypothetical protein